MRRVKDACTKPARSPLLANARSGSQHATKVRTKGQATVEAALLISALLISLLLLIQPGILLYTRMVMEGAAAEGCRVPQQENFHVHDPACSWQIDLSGNEASEEVTVSISTEVKPLPLFDFGLDALGVLNSNGNYELKVSHHLTTKSTWVRENTISNEPERWIERWNDS